MENKFLDSTRYINLENKKINKDLPELYSNKENCCGCGACYSICPVSAIIMQEDEEGFLYPSVYADRCIGCYKCLKVCSFNSKKISDKTDDESDIYLDETKVYASRIKNQEILAKSSSGGMFTTFTDYLIDNNYAVVCSIMDYENKTLEFSIVNDKNKRDEARGSKYFQSDTKNIFSDSIAYLKADDNHKIAFVGTGCQTEAFRKNIYMHNLNDRVLLIDIICHGVPSKKIVMEYIKYLTGGSGKFDYITYKDKRNGWSKPVSLIKYNNKEYKLNKDICYNANIIRLSCNVCPYTKTKRKSDITIGDFWGIEKQHPEFYSETGNSLVLIHSKKGMELFNRIKPNIEYVESSVDKCLQPNLQKPTMRSKDRAKFWNDYNSKSFSYVVKKYEMIGLYKKICNKAKKIIRGKK